MTQRFAPHRRVTCAIALFAMAAVGACDGPAEPQAGPPASLALLTGDAQAGVVATALGEPLAVTVLDAAGRPVPNAQVTWTVSAGQGSVVPAVAKTDRHGVATTALTLGPTAGAQTVTAALGDLAPVTFTASAAAGAPAIAAAAHGDAQQAAVASALADALVVAVRDAHGNPVAAVNVTWTVVAGGGAVTDAVTVTDASGLARTTWRLGTVAGQQVVRANAGALPPASFSASALPGAAVSVALPGDVIALAAVGDSAAITLDAADGYGNVVPAASLTWRTLDDAIASVDASGMVRARANGRVRVIASSAVAADTANIAVGPREIAGAPNFTISGVHITQAVQTLAGTVPLVQGRGGFLRVFARADSDNSAQATVRARIYRSGTLVDTRILTRAGPGVPIVISDGVIESSWNVALPGSLIQPGLAVLVDVDPQDWYGESEEDDNVFPASRTPLSLDVRSSTNFAVRFVPVHQTVNGNVGNVSSANIAEFLDMTERMMPIPGSDADIRAPLFTSAPVLQSGDGNGAWLQILSELYALFVAEGSSRHYYGVVKAGYTSGIAGYGYVGRPVAMGWDHLPSGSRVAAHEFGHNWGRHHSPCGGPGNPDPNYPYSGGISGVVGYDRVGSVLKPPTTTDVMGYCSNQWISDYTYRSVMNFRAAQASASTGTYTDALLVWGQIKDGRVSLEPAFEITTRTALPVRNGPYRIEGLDAEGAILFSIPFAPEHVADSDDASHFAFALPAGVARIDDLATLRVISPNGGAALQRTSAAESAAPRPDPSLRRTPAGHGTAISWNAAAYPTALLRNANTGEILGIARGGDAFLPVSETPIEALFSDGVRSVRRRIPAK